MELHKDKFSFLNIIGLVHKACGIREDILEKDYYVTLLLERIFADKIFAAEFYFDRKMYFDVAKHIYDVSVMLNLQQIQAMIIDRKKFLEMLGYKRLEETRRTGSDLAGKSFYEFKIFDGLSENNDLKSAYENMQKNYVFSKQDILPFTFVEDQWKELQKTLNDFG